MNNVFSLVRFKNVIVRDTVLSWREPAIYIGTLALLVLITYFGFLDDTWRKVAYCLCEYVVGPFGLLYLATHICKNMRKTEYRRTALLVPASNTERYISRILLFMVIPMLAYFGLRLLLCDSMYEQYENNDTLSLRKYILNPYVLTYQAMLSVLYGTIFGRFAIVKGNIALVILQIIGIMFIPSNIDFMFLEPLIEYIEIDPGHFVMVELAYSAAISLVCLIVSFLVFRCKTLKYNHYI